MEEGLIRREELVRHCPLRERKCLPRETQYGSHLKVMVINISGKLACRDCVVTFESTKEL